MDRINEAVKDFITRHGGNKKIIAEKLGVITPQALGRYERGERTPGVEFFEAVKEKYGEDLLNMKPTGLVNEPVGDYYRVDFGRAIAAFDKAIDAFRAALDHNAKHVNDLERDKDWMRAYIDKLTVGLTSGQKAT